MNMKLNLAPALPRVHPYISRSVAHYSSQSDGKEGGSPQRANHWHCAPHRLLLDLTFTLHVIVVVVIFIIIVENFVLYVYGHYALTS